MTSDTERTETPAVAVQRPCSATGWWNPNPYSGRRRQVFHYVAGDGRTLCGKWGYVGLGDLEEGNDDHSENCAECKKKKLALNAKSVKSPNVRTEPLPPTASVADTKNL